MGKPNSGARTNILANVKVRLTRRELAKINIAYLILMKQCLLLHLIHLVSTSKMYY